VEKSRKKGEGKNKGKQPVFMMFDIDPDNLEATAKKIFDTVQKQMEKK
jgi:hypothetical protein